MLLQETKIKLEFEKILESISHYAYSDLGRIRCDNIDFFDDTESLNNELDRVLEIKDILTIEGVLPLDGLKDISKSVSKVKIEGYFISGEEFLNILEFMRVSRKLKKMISDLNRDNDQKYSLTNDLTKNLFVNKILEHNIDITIDENGNVRDNASAALIKIRKNINSQSARLRKTLSVILKRVSEKEYLQDDIITQRDGRYVIPVKSENKRNVQGIIHSSSATGSTVFIEPSEIINLNNEITELHFEEKREIERILRELAGQLTVHTDDFKTSIDILAETDFLQAKARYAVETNSSKPVLGKKYLNLLNAYHPGLLKSHKRSEVVPLNLNIGESFNTLVISGPNAGGKTVVLKTTGIIQLMLQSGMLIPADPESEFRLFRKIFIIIGDEQSIENDLSTFSSHLKSIKEILDDADDNSLVLIDEIASGTDPVLGSALSAAVLTELSKRNSVTIVTTHNSELKEFAYSTEKTENASLEFDINSLSPNFNFLTGVPGQSFTFEIAKKFNFPESVLEEAKKHLSENENRLEDLLKDLHETKQKYETMKNKFDIDNARLLGLTKMYEQKINEIKKNERELKYKAKLDAEKILKDANRLIEKTIKEIRENRQTPKEIKNTFQKETEELIKYDAEFEEAVITDNNININDNVRIRDTNTTGEVIDIIHDTASVNVNGILMKIKISELEKIVKKDSGKKYSGESKVEVNTGKIEFELDIRGKYSHEIEDTVEKFISDSGSSGLKEVSIIHGKGSGKLRSEVHRLLKNNKSVKSFRLGNWNEGDTGVTIIEL